MFDKSTRGEQWAQISNGVGHKRERAARNTHVQQKNGIIIVYYCETTSVLSLQYKKSYKNGHQLLDRAKRADKKIDPKQGRRKWTNQLPIMSFYRLVKTGPKLVRQKQHHSYPPLLYQPSIDARVTDTSVNDSWCAQSLACEPSVA